ncbi:MAG: metal-dependent transcriptional regulator [PVC group bacterium]|nr:metal-dependent transcriptional regulator [PVC group bacterium]
MKIKTVKRLSSNMEDYLETIVSLKKSKGIARVKDISDLMKVKKPSVTSALNMLSQNGLVIHERYSYVELTEEGERVAQNVQKRHNMLISFLVDVLKVDEQTAAKDACRMEHAISPQTHEKLNKFLDKVKRRKS